MGFVGLLAVALFGERIAPHEPIYFVVEHPAGPRPYDPGLVFPLGSDVLGRDLFSLVLAGAQTTLVLVLLSGFARVIVGALLASLLSWWRPARLAIESLAELASAVPATLVALVLVKLFVKGDTNLIFVVGALLVTGWAGPYRVIRAELERLGSMAFTQGADAIGVSRWRLLWRHHLPHLVPVVVLNASQQVVASLVLVAELGVLGIAVGVTRVINIEESLSRVITGPRNAAQIPDPAEWGGLLANARTVESLWTTRWLVIVPGIAFAVTAVTVATIGYALARRYARRDVTDDLRGRGAAALALAVLALFLVSSLVPERYAAARQWAAEARAELRPASDVERAFADAGLQPVAADGYAVRRQTATVVQTGAGSVSAGPVSLAEVWPRRLTDLPDPERTVRSFVSAATGGGVVEAPLVFVGRGISAADHEPPPEPVSAYGRQAPHFARVIRDERYADDYADVDVRGKVVLLVRFFGIRGRVEAPGTLQGYSQGPAAEESIANAIKRGAAAVIFIDPALWLYADEVGVTGRIYGQGEIQGGTNPYIRAEKETPATSTSGVPVVVLSDVAARRFAEPLGIDLSPLFRFDERGTDRYKVTLSRDLGLTARVAVPLERQAAAVASYVAEVPGVPDDAGRILIWGYRRPDAAHPVGAVLAALGRSVADRRVPLILVDFDPSVDPVANAQAVRDVLRHRRVALVVVLERLDGAELRFTAPYGDLIPALDLYAERADVPHKKTLLTPSLADLSGVRPFPDMRTILVRGSGGPGDPRADAAALLGYLAGRLALGAPELPR